MNFALVGKATGLFTVTNIDDLVILTVFFGQTAGRAGGLRVVAGQYLGFISILAVGLIGALGARLLPENVIPYLGLVPLFLGLRAALRSWQHRHNRDSEGPPTAAGPGLLTVAGVTFANGGDNLSVYVPVFATSGTAALAVYVTVFLALVSVWCAAGYWFARRPPVARALYRWEHIVLPVVFIAIGVAILIKGGAFGQ